MFTFMATAIILGIVLTPADGFQLSCRLISSDEVLCDGQEIPRPRRPTENNFTLATKL